MYDLIRRLCTFFLVLGLASVVRGATGGRHCHPATSWNIIARKKRLQQPETVPTSALFGAVRSFVDLAKGEDVEDVEDSDAAEDADADAVGIGDATAAIAPEEDAADRFSSLNVGCVSAMDGCTDSRRRRYLSPSMHTPEPNPPSQHHPTSEQEYTL